MLELIHELDYKENLAVLVGLHYLNLASYCADRIALLVGGHLEAIDTPREVLTSELISQAHYLPAQVMEHPFLRCSLAPLDKIV